MSETVAAPGNEAPVAPAPAAVTAPEAAPSAPAAPSDAAPADWRASLPAELRDAPQLAKFQDAAALAKSYIEAEKLIGRKGVIIPGENATEAEQAAFRKALGVPDDPSAYEIKVNAPEHIWNDGAALLLREGAHKIGLTPKQAQQLAEWYTGTLAAAENKAADEADAKLREEWGEHYERNTSLASRAARELLGPEAAAALRAAGLAHNVDLLKGLARIGAIIAPHDGAAGMMTGSAMSPLAERQRYFTAGTPEHEAYTQPLHPRHLEAQARVRELFRLTSR